MIQRISIGIIIIFLIFVIYKSFIIPNINTINAIENAKEIPEPMQSEIMNGQTIYYKTRQGIIAMDIIANYDISAIVKSKKIYTADTASIISPYDLTLIWGKLYISEIDKYLTYTQSDRSTKYSYTEGIPLTDDYIVAHVANVHIIPKNNNILNQLEQIKENDYIRLVGYLVTATFPNGIWKSSMVRTDTGDGSCEIMYVEKVEFVEESP